MPARKTALPRPLKGGWRKVFYYADELDAEGFSYGPIMAVRAASAGLFVTAVVPPELYELIRQWHLVPMNYDATVSAAVADWVEDHRDVILAHPVNRSKRNRETAAKLIDRIHKNMRRCFLDPERNRCTGALEAASAPHPRESR